MLLRPPQDIRKRRQLHSICPGDLVVPRCRAAPDHTYAYARDAYGITHGQWVKLGCGIVVQVEDGQVTALWDLRLLTVIDAALERVT